MKRMKGFGPADVSRRSFVRDSLLATAALASVPSAPAPAAAPAANLLPTGKIGAWSFTRLILGGNLLTRYQHVRDLGYVGKLVNAYNSDAKVRETIERAEACGINTLSVNVTPAVMQILNDHRKNGGRIQTLLYSTCKIEDADGYDEQIRRMVDFGSEAVYLWGEQGDRCVRENKLDLLRKMLDHIKEFDVPCGIGAHDLQVIKEAEKGQWPADFYVKTFHHHRYPSAPRPGEATRTTSENPGYWCRNPDETAEVMRGVARPWIAFKVMAAGAIPPGDAFPYAFQNGADFVLAGMFDFDLEEDCRITREAVAKAQARARPWRA